MLGVMAAELVFFFFYGFKCKMGKIFELNINWTKSFFCCILVKVWPCVTLGLFSAGLRSKQVATENCKTFIHPPLEPLSVTLSVCDPCLLRATQQCCPCSWVVMLALLSVGPRPVDVAVDCLARWKLLSAVDKHALPWYQVNVWTGGLASLLQVRVTGSPSCCSPAGETETAVFWGESRQEGDERSVTPGLKSYEILSKHWLLLTHSSTKF